MSKILVNSDNVKRIPRERAHFRALLLSNPNYFGNVPGSPLKAVQKVSGNSTYEEFGCVGYQPDAQRLDAVVFVKQPAGYGGDVCSSGTQEYVRFYLSFDEGATWQDQGMVSFTAYDIPGTSVAKRLEYAVSLDIKPPQKYCQTHLLPLARAILSWNVPPPPNSPNHAPVWGDVHNTRIQIEPKTKGRLIDVLQEFDLKIVPALAAAIDLDQAVVSPQAKALTTAELKALYADKKVEALRYAYPDLVKHLNVPTLADGLLGGPDKSPFKGLLDSAALATLAAAPSGEGNTNYEELACIGLNPNQDTLIGVIRVKLPFGFSGDQCHAGSREYVTFWGDFNNNGNYVCLGTTSVKVHDISPMPKGGLEYSVVLPVSLVKYRQPCAAGPRTARIRAILSWAVPHPCSAPNKAPVWGNREDTIIHIRPGPVVPPGTHTPIIETIGGMDVADISPAGLANGTAVTAGFTAKDSPFGGEVIITGHIANTADVSAGATPLKYRVLVSGNGGASWEPVANSFTVKRSQLASGIWSDLPDVTQMVDAGGWYTYYEDLIPSVQHFVKGNLLARWNTPPAGGTYLIKIEVHNPALLPPVWTSNIVTAVINNKAPVCAIAITSGGGNCADFKTGTVIEGTYSVSEDHFGSLTFSVAPGLGGTFTAPASLPREYPLEVPTTGEAGIWKLDTTGMPKCGYVIYLHASDRTIVNSGFIGFPGSAVVGLCLRP